MTLRVRQAWRRVLRAIRVLDPIPPRVTRVRLATLAPLAAVAAALLFLTLGRAPDAGAQLTVGQFARDYPVPGGWFYSQESRYPLDIQPYRGFTVIDDADAAIWTEFRRFGGVQVLGYPVSRRYRFPAPDGFIQQAFQRGIVQWRPELGQAQLANVFEQFTQAGLDPALEAEGIPRALPGTPLPFMTDAQTRMSWITEQRFLTRFFWDPASGLPLDFEEAAWEKLGLPQTFAQRPTYLREGPIKSGPPIYLPYVMQRFQKGGLQLFLQDEPNDPTIVPGDGKKDCVSLTAVGRLARRLGSGTVIPASATKPEPPEIPERSYVTWFIPPLASPNQQIVRFELVGIGFDPGEPISLRFDPLPGGSPALQPAAPISLRIDAADADGSFDRLISTRVSVYVLTVKGERSGKTLAPDANSVIDTRSATDSSAAGSQSVYC